MLLTRFSKNDAEGITAFYEKNGFAIISDALENSILDDFKIEASSIIRAHLDKAGLVDTYSLESIFDQAMTDLENTDHKYIASIYDTICQAPSFFRIIGERSLVDCVRLLMRNPKAPLYGYTNACRIDPPKDERRTYGWHQEVFYTVPKGNYIQSWAPLIRNTTVDNGTIRVAVGSHKEGIAKQSWNQVEGRVLQILVDNDVVDKYEQVSLEMEVGELLLFSGFLAHQSGQNTSDEHRYSLVGMYHDVSKFEFETPLLSFNYRGMTPEDYFKSEFGSSKI